MNKQADLNAILASMKDRLSGAGTGITNWYQKLDPTMRDTMLRGLAGAAVGGTAAGGLAALTPRDQEDKGGVVGPALMGALLGGSGAALLPLGAKMMGSGVRFSSESKRPVAAKAVEAPLNVALNHPLTIGATGVAGWKGIDSIRALSHAMRDPAVVRSTTASAAHRMRDALTGSKAEGFWNAPRHIHDFSRIATDDLKHIPSARFGRGRLAAIPIAAALGLLGDKYLRGDY